MSGAIYHVSVSTRTKASSGGGGGSAASTADYISRHGEYVAIHDKVLHLESGNMPKWARAGKTEATKRACMTYWRAADAYERCNGRLAKVLIIALPMALGLKAQVNLSRTIARLLTSGIDGGCLPWTLAVHAGLDARGHHRNPHFHLMINERINDGIERPPALWFRRAAVRAQGSAVQPAKGGARKTAALTPRAWLYWARELIAKLINLALRVAGLVVRVDHRSNAARGLGRAPQPKLGPYAAALEKRGVRTSRGDHLFRVMRSWRGTDLPSGPILAVRRPLSSQRDADGSFHSIRGPMQKESAPIPRPEVMSTQSGRLELKMVRPRRILRSSLHLTDPRPMTERKATGWWLVVIPLGVARSDSDAESERLAYPDYEQRMLKWVGQKPLAMTFINSPEPHRLLVFTDGTNVRDYGRRIEMVGIAGSEPSVPIDLVTRGKSWSAVRVAGSEPTRRLVCRDLLLRGLRVKEFAGAAEDLATPADVEQTTESTRETFEDLSQHEEYSPHSFGMG
jgi:MobA/MobL family